VNDRSEPPLTLGTSDLLCVVVSLSLVGYERSGVRYIKRQKRGKTENEIERLQLVDFATWRELH
jgi:hypothetical protein